MDKCVTGQANLMYLVNKSLSASFENAKVDISGHN